MAEYSLEEAKEMLEKTLKKCQENLKLNHDDWCKVKDCKTTLEVNMARCAFRWFFIEQICKLLSIELIDIAKLSDRTPERSCRSA
jgi:hypothetical protein